MKTVQVITHCYAVKYPDFAKLLTAQLSSLILWPPKAMIDITICAVPDDTLVRKTVEDLACLIPAYIQVNLKLLPEASLFRRAIGRNEAAKASGADVVWFCDADYVFGEGCLDAVAAVQFPRSGPEFVLPREAFIHRDHFVGDAELERIEPGKVFVPALSLFKPWKIPKAIGGVQIVDGETARQGYLDGSKWIKPLADASLGFQNTCEDSRYRKNHGAEHFYADIPGVYRMRHTSSAFETPEQRTGRRR